MSERWLWPGSSCVRLIDGDSLIAEVKRDLGFHGTATFTQRLRLNRINAPKLSSAAGKDAASKLSALLTQNHGLLLIETLNPYKYGDEWMAEITLPGGTNVSDWMVTSGYAVYWDGTGPRPADEGQA
jgi:endonuclease YncB( thermonuclease family)